MHFTATAATLLSLTAMVQAAPAEQLFRRATGAACGVSSPLTIQYTPLNAPTGTATMVLIGQGVQQYTCGADLTKPPTNTGALAQLYDVSCILKVWSMKTVDKIPKTLAEPNSPGVDKIVIPLLKGLTHVGVHEYESGFPKWTIGSNVWHGKAFLKMQSPDATSGAIPYVQLIQNNDFSSSIQATQVYRVKTWGGSVAADFCADKTVGATTTADYTAEYIFYQ